MLICVTFYLNIFTTWETRVLYNKYIKGKLFVFNTLDYVILFIIYWAGSPVLMNFIKTRHQVKSV